MADSFTQISSFEENIYILATFVVTPLSLLITIVIYAIVRRLLFKYKNDDNLSERNNEFYALNTAWSSLICSICVFLLKIFFTNNLFIPWKYGDNSNYFVSTIDSMTNLLSFIAKITFYFTFTFYFKSLLDKLTQIDNNHHYNDLIISILRVWMFAVVLMSLWFGFIFIATDMMLHSLKEIGITEKHGLYVTNIISTNDLNIVSISLFMMISLEALYFMILCYLYMHHLGTV